MYWTCIAAQAPARGIALGNQTGLRQLFAWDVPTGALRPLGGLSSGTLSPDGRFIYYHQDDQGNEIGYHVRVPYQGSDVPETIAPDLPSYATLGLSISPAGNRLGFVAVNANGFRVYIIDLGPDGQLSKPRCLYHNRRIFFPPTFSADGTLAVIVALDQTDPLRYKLLAFDLTKDQQLASFDTPFSQPTRVVASPLPADARFAFITDQLCLWNPRQGIKLKFEAPKNSDMCDWSPDGERLLISSTNQAIQSLYCYQLPTQTLHPLTKGVGVHALPFFAPNVFQSDVIISHWQDSTHPPQVVALAADTGQRLQTLFAAENLEPARALKSIAFTSSDGQPIQGWLGLPEGDPPFPVILEMHGGPWATASDTFSPATQAWLDHGFAYLTINYRGSLTFGPDFQQKIYGQPGLWELEDLAAARNWLIEAGVAHPQRLLLTGQSYGGYLTLLALGKQSPLWAGGLAAMPITDWAMLYEDGAPLMRAYQVGLFGGPPLKTSAQTTASSPLTYAAQVQAPVFILHGLHDTRAPARPVEVYAATLQQLGKPVELHWVDSGHTNGSQSIEQAIAQQQMMLDFAKRILAKESL